MIRRGKRFLKIGAMVAAALGLLAVALFFFPQTFLCVDSGPVRADVIIVLGGGDRHERAERAAELFLQQAAPLVLVSGAGDDEINRHILLRRGVPGREIILESQSRTTRQNAQFGARILDAEKARSAIIVTSWYHSRRALRTFEHYAPGIAFYSRPSYFQFRHSHWSGEFSRHVYLEYLKLPGYWVRYGVCPL
jgi:uncharacterized SAM-binding protein YcdF (DUF218 family)